MPTIHNINGTMQLMDWTQKFAIKICQQCRTPNTMLLMNGDFCRQPSMFHTCSLPKSRVSKWKNPKTLT